ncbi:MAG: alpha/beta hydrolase-fold protein [Siphonobacter sp.]
MSVKLSLATLSIDDRPVYVTGTFANWLPDLPEFRMRQTRKGTYELTLPNWVHLPFEYKYTRGSWQTAELTVNGENAPNRTMLRLRATDFVPHWQDNGVAIAQELMPDVIVWPSFSMRPFRRKRRVSILLPAGYAQGNQRYPVMYFQDAQNLYGGGSIYGDWALDRKMAIRAMQNRTPFIAVCIDHGDSFRSREYNPYENRWLGKAEGHLYLRFLTETLKPRIDREFRTLPDRLHTGIGGSSMGGLISLAGLFYQANRFGKGLVFSPSLWVSRQLYADASQSSPPFPTQLYLYAGGQESQGMDAAAKRMATVLKARPYDVLFSTNPQGQHSEATWSKELPKALAWLWD